MFQIKLSDSELKVMDILWKEGDMEATAIVTILKETIGWNKNTTYTVIKKCIKKNAIKRKEPNYVCEALVTKEEIQNEETAELIGKVFDSSINSFFTAFCDRVDISDEKLKSLEELIRKGR